MPKAVISIVKGGLGNQLFVYAAGLAFALRTEREFYLDIHRGYTHDNYGRSYLLDRFQISAQLMPEDWRLAPTLKHTKHKLVRAMNKFLPKNWRSYLVQNFNRSSEQLKVQKSCRERVTLNGYWQDEGYFEDFSQRIRSELQPPLPKDDRNLELGREFSESNTVLVHARRVRYPTLLPTEYYRAAIAEIRDQVKNPSFAVFSDDPEWARLNLDFGNSVVTWVEHNADDELADLWLMSCCRHAIIANSSFSWWGAWLGGDPADGRVICSPDHPDWMIRPAKGWRCFPVEIG